MEHFESESVETIDQVRIKCRLIPFADQMFAKTGLIIPMCFKYIRQSGAFKEDGLEERLFFMLFYGDRDKPEWKIDLSFWLSGVERSEPVQDFLEQHLN